MRAGEFRVGVQVGGLDFGRDGPQRGLGRLQGMGGFFDALMDAGQGGIHLFRGAVPGEELGQGAFSIGEVGFGGFDGFTGRNPGGVGDLAGVGVDVHGVVGQGVDAVVLARVLEHVLDPPPGP